MDIVTIVGIREMDFVSKDGSRVNGTQFFYEMESPGVEGFQTGKLFISAQARSTFGFLPRVGESVKVEYNRYGKPAAFEPL